MTQRMQKEATQGSILASLLEMKRFVDDLPERVNKVLDAVSNAELEIKVRTLDADQIMEGLHKIANRIATGIILAGLIIDASLLTRVDTTFRIFGYPGLAMLVFFLSRRPAVSGSSSVFLCRITRARKMPLTRNNHNDLTNALSDVTNMWPHTFSKNVRQSTDATGASV